jgi:hypothetical protein
LPLHSSLSRLYSVFTLTHSHIPTLPHSHTPTLPHSHTLTLPHSQSIARRAATEYSTRRLGGNGARTDAKRASEPRLCVKCDGARPQRSVLRQLDGGCIPLFSCMFIFSAQLCSALLFSVYFPSPLRSALLRDRCSTFIYYAHTNNLLI